MTKIRDFTDFSIFSLIAGSRKLFSTEPISKILDVLKSSRSESFISAIFEVQDQIMIPPDTGPLGDFSKNVIHSPIRQLSQICCPVNQHSVLVKEINDYIYIMGVICRK